MINHILIICSTVIIYEFVRYINFLDIIKSNLKMYQKILKLFKFKHLSDFRKEKLLFNYSKSLFIISLKILLILVSILIFIFSFNLLSNSFLNLVISILGFIEISLIFIIYHLLKKKINAKL